MIRPEYHYYLANKPQRPNVDLKVTDKYTGEVVTRVSLADHDAISKAIEAAVQALEPMRKLPSYHRSQVLYHCVRRFEERHEELAQTLCIEAGKPIRDSRGEVTRLIDTFRIAAEEAVRIGGEVIPLDISERADGYFGQWKRVPVGVCSFISPFNYPLNLAAHKIAPALAAGCPFILKPASFTPLGALIIGEVLAETDLPEGAFSILPCRREGADLFTTDERIKLISFTGSPEVGWELKRKAGKKKVVLELGGNAACLVDADADIDDAISRIIIGAFAQSGQSCISVQRLMIHESLYQEFRARLVAATEALKTGDPKKEETFVGPMISESEAARLEKWIQNAVSRGATIVCGGKREHALLQPTILENVAHDLEIYADEAFGPVVVLSSFQNFDKALVEINESQYGLQAGIFTRDIYKAYRAWDTLEVGGVVIGDIPSWRVDNMPYGGVKNSGLGREGVRFAIEEMTEIRLLVLRRR